MKRFLGLCVAVVGAVICLWAGSSLLVTEERVLGYDPVYAGLAGIAVLVGGLSLRQE